MALRIENVRKCLRKQSADTEEDLHVAREMVFAKTVQSYLIRFAGWAQIWCVVRCRTSATIVQRSGTVVYRGIYCSNLIPNSTHQAGQCQNYNGHWPPSAFFSATCPMGFPLPDLFPFHYTK